jgi:Holliday junction DNA helicase RuvA
MLAEENMAVIECGGVGYLLTVTPSTASRLVAGAEALLYAHMAVRENDVSLYGFTGRDERSMFRKLLGVVGLGPKNALGLLSRYTPDRIAMAVAAEDAAMLAKAPGIGKKTAARIILDLKGSFDNIGDYTPDSGAAMSSKPRQDALDALISLGYSRADALRAILSEDETADAEVIIKKTLHKMISNNS